MTGMPGSYLEVRNLLILYLSLPVTTATSERSFSKKHI
ncbi:hypothetical protein X975_18184, partial [Stegodyphus mimosarum]